MSKLDMSETARLYHGEYIDYIEKLKEDMKPLKLVEERFLDMIKSLDTSYNTGLNAMRDMWLYRHNLQICQTALEELKAGKISAEEAVRALDKLSDK